MLGAMFPALLLALRLSCVFAAVSSWDAVYNVDRRVNRTSLRSMDRKARNTNLLHVKANVDRHHEEPGVVPNTHAGVETKYPTLPTNPQAGRGYAEHSWTRHGHGPGTEGDDTGKGGKQGESSSNKWFWGEESNADYSNWGGPGNFGPSKMSASEPAAATEGTAGVNSVALGAAKSAKQGCAETVTVQPSTRGQDEGTCGFLDLPDRFFMRAKVAEHTMIKGDWENGSGAQYVEWTQDLFAWQYESVYFYTGTKLFMKTEVIASEEVQLPSVKLQNARDNEKKYFTMALKDCNDVLMYVLRETRSPPYLYEIFNRDDQLVAYSEFGSLHVDKMYWFDHMKKPIAVAQSPLIIEDVYRIIDDRADPYFGNIPNWEIKYIKGYYPNEDSHTAILTIVQNRWVIAAAVQERAIRNAARAPDGRPQPPEVLPWFIGLSIFALCVCIGAIAYCFYWIFRLVYPKSYKEVENKFLKHDKKIYGDLVQGRYGT